MKKFQFRLAAAQKVRDMQLQLERSKLHELFARQQQLRNALEALNQERREASALVYEASSVNATDLRALSAFLIGADARVLDLRAQIERQQQVIQQQKKKVLDAERAVKLLSKLREKQYQEWNAEFNREIETIAQESWVGNNFIRNKS